MHGDDDQMVSIELSIKHSAKLIKDAKLQIKKRRLAWHLLACLKA
jgi:hypothetical protein